MDILNFSVDFSTEDLFKTHSKMVSEKQGAVCKKCNGASKKFYIQLAVTTLCQRAFQASLNSPFSHVG